MFVVPSTVQLVVAITLVLVGVCGNLVMPFISCRTNLRCPHITLLAALDFTATLLGPGIMLVILVKGPTWLVHNKALCQTLNVLSTWQLISIFLVLFALAVFCQTLKHYIRPAEKRRASRKQVAFLAVCLLVALVIAVIPLLNWSSHHGLSFLHSCAQTKDSHLISSYSLFFLVFSFIALLVTSFLGFRVRKHRRLYPLQIFWERHQLETKINDPELTTTASSNTSWSRSRRKSIHSRIQSRIQSRRSSVRSRSGTILSHNTTESPIASRRNSIQQLRPFDNSLLEIILRNVRLDRNASEDANVKDTSPTSVDNSSRKDSQSSSPSIQLSIATSYRDPFVISSRIHPKVQALFYPRKVFHSPRFLPQFTALQQRLSLSRLLSLRCCLTIFCWLPLYVSATMQLFSANYLHQLHAVMQWLIFIQSSSFSLLPVFDKSYRRALKRSVSCVFKACVVRRNNFNLSKSLDGLGLQVEREGTEQVQLKNVVLSKV